LGFEEFIIFDQGRNKGPVYDKKGRYLYNLDREAELRFDDVKQHMAWNNSKNQNQSRRLTEPSRDISCLSKEKQSIYVAANGEVYPCCYLGFNPRTLAGMTGNQQIKKLFEDNDVKNDARESGLEQCISWFNLIEESWSKPTFAEGNMYICTKACGKCN
jgi:hypothetical protein